MLEESGQPLSKTHPGIASQWDYRHNKVLTPDQVSACSSESVWWRCHAVESHIWVSSINHRTATDSPSCPWCSDSSNQNRPAHLVPDAAFETADGSFLFLLRDTADRRNCPNGRMPDDESLAEADPTLVAGQWHKKLNRALNPEKLGWLSPKKVWWQCLESGEHVWKASIYSRTMSKTNCPVCATLKADSTNCLAATNPDLAAEWHPTENLESGLTPQNVTKGCDKWVVWQCLLNKSHCWKDKPFRRAQENEPCPFCSGRVQRRTSAHLILPPKGK